MKKKSLKWLIVLLVLVLIAAACLTACLTLPDGMENQEAAARWTGSSDVNFAQLSCYMSEKDELTLDKIYSFRQSLETKLTESSLEAPENGSLYHDAWSASGKVTAYSESGGGDAFAIAVGGDFFFFHPLKLLSGSYISEEDVMDDRVVLDRELAWKLFGGVDLAGMTVTVNGKPFVVAGVVEREQDKASRKLYSGGPGLYMSYTAYTALTEAPIDSYEIVMAQPVENFAEDIMKNTFPIGEGELINNTGRFSLESIFGIIKTFGTRSAHQTSVIYPYWENAARYVEDWCALWLALAMVFAVLPMIAAFILLIILLIRGKDYLEDKVPEWTENAVDKVRRKKYAKRRSAGAHVKK